MKIIILLLLVVSLFANVSANAACTITCYVDDDGTGNYNVDHNQDEVEINAAIMAVSNYATAGNKGTVVLNYTLTPYDIINPINMPDNTVLEGENSRVTIKTSKTEPGYRKHINIAGVNNVVIRNLSLKGSKDFWYCCGSNLERLIQLGYNGARPTNVLIENVIGYNSSDDFIRGSGINIIIRNVAFYDSGHAAIVFEGGSSNVNNIIIDNVYCRDLGNACVRPDSMINGIIKNVYALDTPSQFGTQFAVQLATSSEGYLIKNLYIENITAKYMTINGVILSVDPSVTSKWLIQNITFKNVLIDCLNSCKSDGGSDYFPRDRPGGIRMQSVTDIFFDSFTVLNAPDGFLVKNYISGTSKINIKNGIILNNTHYGIKQIDGNTNFDWSITNTDIWGNSLGNTYGYVSLGNGILYQNPYLSDYRLKSQYGRWTGSSWTTDSVTSPAIDAGDPSSDYSNEPIGNGNRINLGFEGNTKYASKSASGPYSISGYVLDNNGDILSDVLVTDGVNSSNTDDHGFYNIKGLYKGTYNFEISKEGFNTGSLQVTIAKVSISNANKTIYDTTAPSVTGLTATKTNSTEVTLSYDATGSWYKIYRDGVLKATIQSNSWIDKAVSLGNTYQYSVSAKDNYGNQGNSSSVKITIYPYTVTNLTPLIDTAIKSGQPDLTRSSSTWIDIGTLSGNDYGNYRGLLYFDVSTIPSSAKISSAILTLTWEGENRNHETVLGVYRPSSSWDAASWNNRQNSVSWTTQGGDWIDRNGVSYGSSPYAEVTYPVGSTNDAVFNVASIVKEYVNGNYSNTGFFLKANELENTYISFYSSKAPNAIQRPKLTINYTTPGDTPSNPAPSITDFTPSNLSPQYPANTISSFTVTTDQSVSNTWFSDGINQDIDTQAWFNIWSLPGQHNVTYVGSNSNGSVSMTWNVSIIPNNDISPVPNASVNLIKNGGIESGKDYWTFYTNGAGTFSIASSGYEGTSSSKLAITKGGSNIQFYQTGVTLEPNTRYRLSFAAYSNTGHSVTIRLIKHVKPYTAYAPDYTTNLGTSWQTFTTEFTTPNFRSTVSDGRLMFWLAPFVNADDVYYIDNIILEKI